MRSVLLLALLALLLAAQAPLDGAAPAPDWADCVACHPQPASNLPRLAELRIEGLGPLLAATCLDCHPRSKVNSYVSDWRHPTASVAAHLACTDCHVATPHAVGAPPPRPQGDYLVEGCYTCHGDVRRQFGLFSHHRISPAVQCRDCHPAHQPFAAVLPAALLPTDIAPYWRDSFDWLATNRLCVNCHSPSLLMLGTTEGFVTLNTVNYHTVHVQRGQVACLECHTPHGSLRPFLLRPQLLTGEGFTYLQRIDGGTCAVNCHDVAHDDWRYTNRVD